MEQEEDEHSLEAKFSAAVKVVHSLPVEGPFQPSDEMMLMFYSYHKQATTGPCNVPRPNGFWDAHGKTKWDAWNSLGNMTKEEAMKNYIEDIQLILETVPVSDEVSDLVQKLGNFYTEVDGDGVEVEENGVDKRPFTMPFADHGDDLMRSAKKPVIEGYGDLWDDIQNLQEKDRNSSVHSVSSEEGKRSRHSSAADEDGHWRRGNEELSLNTQEETREWSPDPRFLTVEDQRWRSDTKGSGGSAAPSLSSYTNGTHSSLNSEAEEELVCSIEPCAHYDPYMQFNGCFIGHDNAAFDKNHRSTDSENEEYCDSIDHQTTEERLSSPRDHSPGSGAATVRPNDLWFESNTTLNRAEGDVIVVFSPNKREASSPRRQNASPSPKHPCGSGCVTRAGLSGYGIKPIAAPRSDINKLIAVALLGLQSDMTNALKRLHTLEELARSQSSPSSPRQELPRALAQKILFLKPSWWPFDISPLTTALTFFWPFISAWLVQLYLQRKRRKVT